jgi:muconolactone D-isomerase
VEVIYGLWSVGRYAAQLRFDVPTGGRHMLFHVCIDVHLPLDMNPEKLKDLSAREHARARELQLQGKWTHLWRVAGKYSNISIFDVEDPAELHDVLNSLPLYPFMEVQVTALCKHPGSLELNQ